MRKAFERAINPEAAKAAEEAERLAAAKAAELKAQQQRQQQEKAEEARKAAETVQKPRENVYENVYAQNPEYRPQNNERRTQGGERRTSGGRPQGERPARNGGAGRGGDRQQRPYGERGGRGDGSQRTYQNGKPNQNNNRGNSYRGRESGSGRLEREIDRFNKESAAAAPDEIRGKDYGVSNIEGGVEFYFEVELDKK